MDIKESHIVVKSNFLNEMRGARISENEYKLFCIYLSRINPNDPKTSKVTFSLKNYGEIMKIKRPRREELQKQADSLIGKTISVDREDGGFNTYALFIQFELSNDDGEWQISITSNPGLEPYLFKHRNRFFKYKLYHAIYLDSYNQMRIYELLKQYEKIKERTIALKDLREFLGMEEKEYPVWGIFARDVIKKSQKVIADRTDIRFEFEPVKKVINGKCRVVAIKFIIEKNENYIDQMRIEDFVDIDKFEEDNEADENLFGSDEFVKTLENDNKNSSSSIYDEKLEFLAEACENEFCEDEIRVLYDIVKKIVPCPAGENVDRERYDYLLGKYNQLKLRAKRKDLEPIKSRFGYLKKLIEADIQEQ